MRYILATFVQTDTSPAPQSAYADNTSMLHHMSDALFQSLYRVLSLLIAILPRLWSAFHYARAASAIRKTAQHNSASSVGPLNEQLS